MLYQGHHHITDFLSIQTKEQWGEGKKFPSNLQKRNPLFFLSLTRTIPCPKAHNTPFNFSFLIRFFSFLPTFHLFSKFPAINILTSLPLYRYIAGARWVPSTGISGEDFRRGLQKIKFWNLSSKTTCGLWVLESFCEGFFYFILFFFWEKVRNLLIRNLSMKIIFIKPICFSWTRFFFFCKYWICLNWIYTLTACKLKNSIYFVVPWGHV